jgi:hypothetical protein
MLMITNRLALLAIATSVASISGSALAATEPTTGLAVTSAALAASSGYFFAEVEVETSTEVARVRPPTSRDNRQMGDDR